MSSRLTLQRLRFFRQQPAGDPYFETIPADWWIGRGSATYWGHAPGAVRQGPEGIEVAAGGVLSSDTFFNAFHASYWRKLTRLRSLSLHLRFAGRFLLQVFRHTELGESEPIDSRKIGSGGQTEFDFPFGPELPPGIRFSFSLTALEAGSRLLGGEWHTADPAPPPVRLGIVIATYSRPESVASLVRSILDDDALRGEDVGIRVTDQGNNPLLPPLEGERFRIIRQPNYGTGGFSRAIYESVLGVPEAERPTHILIIDDDVALEVDSILRAIRMAQFAKAPFLAGGTMFDLYRPHQALTLGEFFEWNESGFRSVRQHLPTLDVTFRTSLDALGVPCTAGYCAWWFSMMPTEAILKIGLPIPLFVRGEDIQYGMRAKAAGYPPVTLPGLGVWHQPFYARASWWIPYTGCYNYLILHSQSGYNLAECALLFRHNALQALHSWREKQYGAAAAVTRALEDYLGGWKHFRERTFPAHFQELRDDIVSYENPETFSPEKAAALPRRVEAALRRFHETGEGVHRELAAKLPASWTFDSWRDYFPRGNLTALPE